MYQHSANISIFHVENILHGAYVIPEARKLAFSVEHSYLRDTEEIN